jgi:hypothetical protein
MKNRFATSHEQARWVYYVAVFEAKKEIPGKAMGELAASCGATIHNSRQV